MKLISTFKKQGGFRLLKQYWKGGSLFAAVNQFIVLGKSRTALEILRLSTQLKIKQKLEKKYKKYLVRFDEKYDNALEHKKSDKVWVCWFQGMENAPVIVKKCYESLKENLVGKEIILITSENMCEYVNMPEYIIDKWKKGQITNTHMTDLLRLELLINYGGMWIDATVLCTSKDIPDYFFDSDLFLYQSLKPGRDGQALYISSWLICAKTNNRILMAARELCYEYWKKNKDLVDYFLVHHFISIALDFYEEDWHNIMPSDNSIPHILLLRLFDKFDEEKWKHITSVTNFHKLTYKFDESQTYIEDTFYKHIMKE